MRQLPILDPSFRVYKTGDISLLTKLEELIANYANSTMKAAGKSEPIPGVTTASPGANFFRHGSFDVKRKLFSPSADTGPPKPEDMSSEYPGPLRKNDDIIVVETSEKL